MSGWLQEYFFISEAVNLSAGFVGPGMELLFCFHNVTYAVPEKQN